MQVHDLREPASALTHALGAAVAIPATWWFWRKASVGGPWRQGAVLVYGLSLVGCLAASAAYHAAPLSPEGVAALRRVDHIGIHLLIAGTCTPIAWTLLQGRMRATTLGLAWFIAGIGSAVLLCWGVLPPMLFTSVYLASGWGVCFAYFEIARTHTHRTCRPILLGGMAYSVGAVLNIAEWPVLITAHFEAHEVFHLFVLVGASWHYLFMVRVVAPHKVEPWPSCPSDVAVDTQAGRRNLRTEIHASAKPIQMSHSRKSTRPVSAPSRR